MTGCDCGRCFRIPLLIIVLVASLMQLSSAYGAKWSFDPNITVSETYTDNVTLESSADAESDWITQITPGFSFYGEGKNLSLSSSYTLQNLFYVNDSSRNISFQQFRTAFNATLLPRHIFIDASTSIDQQVLNYTGKASAGNFGVTGNRTDVQSSSISPYFRTGLGGELETELRYNYDSVKYSKSSSQNSTSDGVSMDLRPAHINGSWGWSLNYQKRNINYQDRPDEKLENTSVNTRYIINSHLGVVGTVGYDNNTYSSIISPSGEYWNLDVNWNPSPRTALTFGGGERYYGPSWNLSFSHQARRNNWLLSYSESLSSQRLQQLNYSLVPLFDTNGNPLIDPNTGIQSTREGSYFVSFNQVFLSKLANASWGIHVRKFEIGADVYSELRVYQDNGAEDTIEGGSIDGDWKMNRRNKLLVAARWQKARRQLSNDNYLLFSMSFSRQIRRRVTGDINFSSLQRSGTNSLYTENLISVILKMSL